MNEHQLKLIKALGEYNTAQILLRNANAKKLGINAVDMECLNLLSLKGGISTPTEIARHTGLTTGSTTAMLDRLEKARLISRKPNPKDRRGVLIEVSDSLGDTLRESMTELRKVQNKLIDNYSDNELELIAWFLESTAGNVKEYTKKTT
jgi:DNA-binding MarR family transcriptional regulator